MLQIQQMESSTLKPWEDNPRLNDKAVGAVAQSIRTFGFNVPILCDQNLTIIAGHTRWKAAKELGLETVPVIVLEMTDAQRRAFSVADNKTAEIADWDMPKLREVLAELSSEDIDLRNLGFSDQELRRYLESVGQDEDEIPELNGEPRTRQGELIALGSHRLPCGDSRDSGMINALTAGDKVQHVFGGPPCFNQKAFSHWDEYQDYLVDMSKVMGNCANLLEAGGILAWHIGGGSSSHHDHVGHHSVLLEESGPCYVDTIIWAKRGANYAIPRNSHIKRNRHYYPALQWEAILIFQKPGKMPKMTVEGAEYMSKHHTNIWDIPAVTNQLEAYGHPAVCPAEIPYRCLQAYTGTDVAVFEPFGGSGTTLIAAEKASRRAFIMERSPAYCDVIVRRWEDLTGGRAERINRRTNSLPSKIEQSG